MATDPAIRYGSQRMNVLNHTISTSNDWDREMGVEERSRKKKGGKGAKADTFLTPDRWAAGGW